MRVKFLAQGNGRNLWWVSNSRLTGIHRSIRVKLSWSWSRVHLSPTSNLKPINLEIETQVHVHWNFLFLGPDRKLVFSIEHQSYCWVVLIAELYYTIFSFNIKTVNIFIRRGGLRFFLIKMLTYSSYKDGLTMISKATCFLITSQAM